MEATERQREIYHFMADYFYHYGVIPGIRKIGSAVGLRGPAAIKYQLDQLVEGGLVDRVPGLVHGLSLHGSRQCPVPLVGRIAAGLPLQLPESTFPLTDYDVVFVPADMASPDSEYFAVEVKGNSMIDALVKDRDIVILRRQEDAENGDMVAALLVEENETTLKYLYEDPDKQQVELRAANPTRPPIYVDRSNLLIQGKVVGLMRRF